ncbi:hypothetical protein ADIS_3307 [Lunatimonas lonarensis]|uniref:Uncharacterized protein n=1 Tax=Lunatimonas lonarensis TaxID=1232681 RepID=R7ZQ96_9BACT|nr:hypothetical protein ADIS_3307 [Lunatimonas lonarensis]
MYPKVFFFVLNSKLFYTFFALIQWLKEIWEQNGAGTYLQ